MFSSGMGFRILVVFCGVEGVWQANRVFAGMSRETGEWSEFRLWSLFVVDVYRVLLGEWM